MRVQNVQSTSCITMWKPSDQVSRKNMISVLQSSGFSRVRVPEERKYLTALRDALTELSSQRIPTNPGQTVLIRPFQRHRQGYELVMETVVDYRHQYERLGMVRLNRSKTSLQVEITDSRVPSTFDFECVSLYEAKMGLLSTSAFSQVMRSVLCGYFSGFGLTFASNIVQFPHRHFDEWFEFSNRVTELVVVPTQRPVFSTFQFEMNDHTLQIHLNDIQNELSSQIEELQRSIEDSPQSAKRHQKTAQLLWKRIQDAELLLNTELNRLRHLMMDKALVVSSMVEILSAAAEELA